MIKKTIILATILIGSNLAHGNETISTKASNIIGGVIGVSGVTGILPAVGAYQCLDLARDIASTSKRSAISLLGMYLVMSQASTAGAAITFSHSILERTAHLDRNLALNVVEAAF